MFSNDEKDSTFDPVAFLEHAGLSRRTIDLKPKQTFFSQGDPADSVFYLQQGRVCAPTIIVTRSDRTECPLLPTLIERTLARRAVEPSRWFVATALCLSSSFTLVKGLKKQVGTVSLQRGITRSFVSMCKTDHRFCPIRGSIFLASVMELGL